MCVDHVNVCLDINFASVSTIFKLDFGTVPVVWYFLFF